MGVQDLYIDDLDKIYKKWVTNASLGHPQKSHRRYDFDDQSTFHAISHMTEHHNVTRKGEKVNQPIVTLFKQEQKPTLQNQWTLPTAFPVDEFEAAFLEYVIGDNLTLRQSVSSRLRRMCNILHHSSGNILPSSHNTSRSWILKAFDKEKTTIRAVILSAQSKISISFDAWQSDHDLLFLGVVGHFLDKQLRLQMLLLGLPELQSHTGAEQSRVLLQVLNDYGIHEGNLGWFVLDNATNNNTALVQLSLTISFDPLKRRLRCAGHLINLAAEAFLDGDHPSDIEARIRAERTETAKLKLWREKGPIGQLHNTVFYITRSSRRKAIFNKCQIDNLTLAESDRICALIRDDGVRWNSTYMMIKRAIRLRESLDEYYHRLTRSLNPADKEAQDDELSSDDWEMLVRIKSILGPFFQATKRMEGNAVEGTHGALWEVVVSLECLIQRLEEQQVILSNDLGKPLLECVCWIGIEEIDRLCGKNGTGTCMVGFIGITSILQMGKS